MAGDKVLRTIMARRSVRAFGPEPVSDETLARLVDAARVAPSAANLQPLSYVAVSDPELLPKIFECLKWAAYIAPLGNPPPGKEPKAYVVVLVDKSLARADFVKYDVGASVENLILAAWEIGLASCWIGSVNRPRVTRLLAVPDRLEVDCVVALGTPAESPVMVEMKGDDLKYWRDEAGVHYVPKRPLLKILHRGRFGEK